MAKRKPPPGELKPDGHDAPWRAKADGVKGVVPPGSRLDTSDKRERPWHATGVARVTPPGTQDAGKGAAAEWVNRKKKAKSRPAKIEAAPEPPKLKEFLDRIGDFFADNPPEDGAMLDLSREITQTHAPFEIIVAFTVLSSLVGDDEAERRRYHLALERGAKAYFNLARRLDKRIRPPRGLVPQTLDPLFYDLPDLAYQIPLSFSTQALCGLLDLLRNGPAHDRKLIDFANTLRSETVEGQTFGDQSMERMFPWTLPDWAPRD